MIIPLEWMPPLMFTGLVVFMIIGYPVAFSLAAVGFFFGFLSIDFGYFTMPFMQAIGMEKDELVQALGVFFTTATVALAFNLTSAGLLTAATALPGAVAMAGAFTGVFIGQAVRSRLEPEAFRRWFLIAMILLGIYLAGSALYNVMQS